MSQHLDTPPKRVIEIGGGFGVLGEILVTRDASVCYVDADIPPLVCVASFYLSEVLGAGNVDALHQIPKTGKLRLERSAAIPNWRIPDLVGPFDLFVNSFSFQEMEPDVVEHYIELVVELGVRWILSLNSYAGKRRAEPDGEGGALVPVTSQLIVDLFQDRGYSTVARHRRPLLSGAGELVILRSD